MSKLFFKDDSPIWFVSTGTAVLGPLKASEVYDKLTQNEISWVHFASHLPSPSDKDGRASTWQRICDIDEFKNVGPQAPETDSKPQVKKSEKRSPMPEPPAEPVAQDWFLYYNQSQNGPFSVDEIQRMLKIGKIHGRVHAWKEGMSEWARLSEISEFEAVAGEGTPTQTKVKFTDKSSGKTAQVEELRTSPRKPLVAKILAASERILASGICRDISVGEMQVLCDRVPGKVGDHIQLNISPVDAGKLQPFVAKGVIVRVFDAGEEKGFSFRFESLNAEARGAIEKHIAASEK